MVVVVVFCVAFILVRHFTLLLYSILWTSHYKFHWIRAESCEWETNEIIVKYCAFVTSMTIVMSCIGQVFGFLCVGFVVFVCIFFYFPFWKTKLLYLMRPFRIWRSLREIFYTAIVHRTERHIRTTITAESREREKKKN